MHKFKELLDNDFLKTRNNQKHIQEFKELKENVTQEIATLKQNQAKFLEMKRYSKLKFSGKSQ